MKCLIVLGVVLIGMASSEVDTQIPVLQRLGPNLNISALNISGLNISVPDMSGLDLPANFTSDQRVKDAEKAFREKCQKNGGEGAYERATAAIDEVQTCAMSLVNVTELSKEMEEAKPTGDLDIVFKKYCKKSPDFQRCIKSFTAAFEPCLDEPEKETKRIIENITASLLDFVCFDEGDRIALFIAEGGPECLQSKSEAIQDCINQTVASYISPDKPLSPGSLPALVLDEKECGNMRKIKQCVVQVLQGCSGPTPSNIVDSMLEYIWRMTKCNSMQQAGLRADGSPGSSARALTATAAVVVSALLPAVVRSRLH